MSCTNLSLDKRPPTYEVLPLTALRGYSKNPRHHSAKQVTKIAASIREFGFTNPILIDEDGELIAGHGRLAAAQQIKMSQIPCIRVNGLTDTQKRTLRIADNRIAERSRWSKELLAEELHDLVILDADLELTGFDIIEIDNMLTLDGASVEEDEPLEPPPARPVTRLGDLWRLGEHRLLCGDSRNAASFAQVLGGARADLVITDPPFNVPISGHVSGLGRNQHAEFAMASGEMTSKEFVEFLTTTLGNARDSARDGSLHYIFIDWRSLADVVVVGRSLFTELKNIIAWVKPNPGMGSFYRSQHEMVVVFKLGRAPHTNNVQLGRMGRNRSNVWSYPGASGFSAGREANLADHPTVKPTRMIADAIRDASAPGGLVLDPFGGSGTTLLAAQDVGRRAAVIEFEPAFVDVALRRFTLATGIDPICEAEGCTFSQLKCLREERKE